MKPTKLQTTALVLIVLSPVIFIVALMAVDYRAALGTFSSNIPYTQPQRAYR